MMSQRLSRCRTTAVLSLLVATTGVGQARVPQATDRAAVVDVGRLGPRVGDALPTFTLRDQHGEARSLTSLLGPNGAVIVLFRSADW